MLSWKEGLRSCRIVFVTVRTRSDSWHSQGGSSNSACVSYGWGGGGRGRCPPWMPVRCWELLLWLKMAAEKGSKTLGNWQTCWTLTHGRKSQIMQEVLSWAFKIGAEVLKVSQPQGLQRGQPWGLRKGLRRTLPRAQEVFLEVCLQKMGQSWRCCGDLPGQSHRDLRNARSCTVAGNAKLQTSAFLKDGTSKWHVLKLDWFGRGRQDSCFLDVFKGSRT